MKSLELLQEILTASVKRSPEKPLTNSHLLNIVNMAIRVEDMREERINAMLDDMLGENRKWGNDS